MGLQPGNRVDVEVVRGLVEDQRVGLLQKQPGESGPHLPASGHFLQRPVHVFGGKAEPAKDSPGLRFQLITAQRFKSGLQLAIPLNHCIVISASGGAHLLFQCAHLLLEIDDVSDTTQDLLENRSLP